MEPERLSLNISVDNIYNLCRICIHDTSGRKYIEVLDGSDPDLVTDIFDYFKVSIKADDEVSKKICQDCYNLIQVMRIKRQFVHHRQVIINFFHNQAIVSPENRLLSIENSNERENRVALSSIDFNDTIINVPLYKTLKKTNNCPFCIFPAEKNKDFGDSIEFCPQHTRTFACLVSNCVQVFTQLGTFKEHYHTHSKISKQSLICSSCYDIVLDSKTKHKHKAFSIECCNIEFNTMTRLVKHKFQNHDVKIVTKSMKLTSYDKPNKNFPNATLAKILYSEKLYTCIVPKCTKVFTDIENNYNHYRYHACITDETVTCSTCLTDCNLIIGSKKCEHANPKITCELCKITFKTLDRLAKHKIQYHCALILCGKDSIVGCPICCKVFEYSINASEHYIQCFNNLKMNPIVELTNDELCLLRENVSNNRGGKIKCKLCDNIYLKTVNEYIEHSSIVHNTIFPPKGDGIKLCPICDKNYSIEKYVSHIAKCTDSMKLNGMVVDTYGCACCKLILPMSPSRFRNHFMFCKSFKKHVDDVVTYYTCLNCTYKTNEVDLCIAHANYGCIYFQLKQKYAMGPNETEEVANRNRLEKLYSKYQPPLDNSNQTPIFQCDLSRRKLLKCAEYLCNFCNQLFYCELIFNEHINIRKQNCRRLKTWYCKNCVTDFDNEDNFNGHKSNNELVEIPDTIPIPRTYPQLNVIKSEPSDSSPSIKIEILDSDDAENMEMENQNDDIPENSNNYSLNEIKTYEDLDMSIYAPSTSYQRPLENPLMFNYDDNKPCLVAANRTNSNTVLPLTSNNKTIKNDNIADNSLDDSD